MMRPPTWAVASVLVTQITMGVSRRAWAATPAADSATTQQAQDRFRRGIRLYNEGNADGALVELERAYQLVPNFKILYNLGQVSYQAHNYAAALGYFRRYLADGGDQIPATRRAEIDKEIRSLVQRTGQLDIQTADTGSEIFVDDAPAGTTPLSAPVLANVGRHRVEVVSGAGQRRSRQVELASEETVVVHFDAVVPVSSPPAFVPTASALAESTSVSLAPTSDLPPERRARSSNWLSWTLTGALAVGAGVAGGLAWQRSSAAEDELGSFPASRPDLDNIRSEQRTFSLISDGLWLGTLVMAGVSLYLSLSSDTAERSSSRSVDVARLSF